MLRITFVLAVYICKTNAATLDLSFVNRILNKELGQQFPRRIAGSLAMLRNGHRKIIALLHAAVLIPGIHGVHFRSGAIDIFSRAYSDCLLKKVVHAFDVCLEGFIHMVEMLRVDNRCAVNINQFIILVLDRHNAPLKVCHLLFVVQIILKELKTIIIDAVRYSLDGRCIEVVKPKNMVRTSFYQDLSNQFISCHTCYAADCI